MKRKQYWEMNSRELAEATRDFDRSLVIDESRELTPAETKRWQRVKRKRGRPKVGQGFQRISVSIERSLLKRVNTLAKQRRVSRSLLFAQVLTEALNGR